MFPPSLFLSGFAVFFSRLILLRVVCSFAGSWFQWTFKWYLVPWYTCWPQNLRIGGKPLMQPVVNHLATFIHLLCIGPCNRAIKLVLMQWLCKSIPMSIFILMLSEVFSAFNLHLLTPWYFQSLQFPFSSCFSFQVYEDKNLYLW